MPLVTTTTGAHGLRLESSNSSFPPCYVASNASEFLEYIKILYTDEVMWTKLSKAGARHAREHFSLYSQAHDLENAINVAFSDKEN